MKRETNNEIDLLLRQMGRRDGSSVFESEAGDQHLDVDELSSYAQNALPAAARARYTEHLAECSTCRKLVTELSLSLGAATVAAPVETAPEPSGFKKFLAALFSPLVVRYAGPALGLVIVAVIGFVVLLERSRDGLVAQMDTTREAPVSATEGVAAPVASPDGDKVFDDYEGQRAEPTETARKAAGVGGNVPETRPVPASPPADDAAAVAQPKPAAAEPPSARVAAVTESEAQIKEEQKSKDAVAKKPEPAANVKVQSAEDRVSNTNEQVRGYQSAPQTAVGNARESQREIPARQRSVDSLSRGRSQTETDNAETRTVSGRRFRKERGIWTDTAYDSSTSTTNVARGSEQFRALVADEPEIKTIAAQLDGEVIVVWKGRAYRIR